MSILNNARDSIIIGIEDYKFALDDGDEKRYLSSTRNLFAGILLLFKYKLSVLSPRDSDEVLIKKRINPYIDNNGTLGWKGKGSNTVDVAQIKERFESLNINAEWDRIKIINDYRNNIEHYYSKESAGSIQKIISDCFLVINNFVTNELLLDPKELLGEYTWNILISINEVYEAEKKSCNTKLHNEYDWMTKTAYEAAINYYCDDCFSDLITINEDNELYCKSCEQIFNEDSFLEAALVHKFGLSIRDIQQGGEADLFTCPNCDRDTYTRAENICHLCGETQELNCVVCGDDISDQLECGGICYYCQNRINKLEKA